MSLRLDPALLSQFVGGQLEHQSGPAPFRPNAQLHRGEIAEICQQDDDLLVRFEWLGKGVGGVPPTGWDASDELEITIPLADKSMKQSPHPAGYMRYVIASANLSEMATLFPPGRSGFSPAIFNSSS